VHKRVVGYTAALAAAMAGILVVAVVGDLRPPGEPARGWLPVLALALVGAELARVRFRRGDDVDEITLFEAVLAPLIFAFPAVEAVAAVVVAQTAAAVVRRSTWVKGLFNVIMWSLAAGTGSVVLGVLATGADVSPATLGFVMVALTCVAVVNNSAFTGVLALSSGQSLGAVLRGLAPVIVPGWVGGWLVNLLMGLLFVLAYAGHPGAVVLFAVPLAMLHMAYRGYASARADRLRLTGLREAARALAEPLQPRHAIDGFLREVANGFEARGAALVLRTESGQHETHLLPDRSASPPDPVRSRASTALERDLAGHAQPLRLTHGDGTMLAARLDEAGWRDCLSAPLEGEARPIGAVVLFDQTGLEGSTTSDLAVLEALARETAHTFARGLLFESVMEERRKLDQIVTTTSDGIFTLGADGTVLSWNAACERITGLTAPEVLGRVDTMQRLHARTSDGSPIDVRDWAADSALPSDILVQGVGGHRRRLSCSVSPATGADSGAAAFVVVARDITPSEEYEELRGQVSQLVEAQAAQRLVVDHLQRAVAPDLPVIDGADMAVRYVASDPSSPTGGDLYDWFRLPSGELHVAVVDALGHGVAATKAALTVIHTLRYVAAAGTPLEQLVGRADELLSAQDGELVATAVVARYHPDSGALRVVSGGHPPALVVHTGGAVTQLAATGGAIGWPGVGSDNVVTTELAVGESLVLYTDGLIEARKDVLQGLASLVRHAADVSDLPAGAYAYELVQRSLAGADRRDDSLALVIRRTAPALVGSERASRVP